MPPTAVPAVVLVAVCGLQPRLLKERERSLRTAGPVNPSTVVAGVEAELQLSSPRTISPALPPLSVAQGGNAAARARFSCALWERPGRLPSTMLDLRAAGHYFS